MDYSEIMEITNGIEIDEKEFENIDIELSDLEMKKIKKNLKKSTSYNRKSSDKKPIKKIIVASITICVTLSSIILLTKPAFAERIELFESVYEKLGYYKEYKDYSQFIGETKEVKEYKFTIDKLLLTPDRVKIAIKVSSEKPFDRTSRDTSLVKNLNCFVELSGVNPKSGSSTNHIEYIDDKNALIVHEAQIDGDNFKKRGDISIGINSTSPEIEDLHVEFNFKVDFEKSFNKTINKRIDKKVDIGESEIYIREMKTSQIGTTIKSNIFDFMKYGFLVQVDNKIYYYVDGNLTTDEGTSVFIKELTYDVMKKAKSIKIIPVYMENRDIEHDELFALQLQQGMSRESEVLLSDDIETPRKTNFVKDVEGEIYKIEKKNNKIRVYYDCDERTLAELSRMYIYCEEDKELPKLVIEKDPDRTNGYFIEREIENNKEYKLIRTVFKVKYKTGEPVNLR